MKRKMIIILIITLIILTTISNADEENSLDTNSVIESQKSSIDVSSFLDSAKNYSTEVLYDMNMSDVFSQAISGNIDNSSIGKKILEKFLKELLGAIGSISSIIIIILIHSILKNFSDGLENSSVSQITYYVSYILIVTIIMKNFADIINLVKTSIENLNGFINCLFPILITLMVSSGAVASSTTLEPVILFIITLTGNIITKFIIPLCLISLALNIISNISDKVQISKLSKFINSASIWVLGIILTVFVTVASLEGNITKRS